MMIWLKLVAFGMLGLIGLTIIILAVGTLISLDWGKRHARATAALDTLKRGHEQADGLVRIESGELSFRARVANMRGDGDAVILLHGFPQTSAAWQPLIDAAAGSGYRVIAFDQRGYSPGARPGGIAAYTKTHLVSDVLGVANAAGFKRFHLVGHDWGSAVAWSVLMAYPDRVLSLSSLSIPHPLAFGEAVQTDPDQRKRSRYIAFFRTPWLPELILSFNRRQLFRTLMYQWMPKAHVEEYLAVFAEPGALTGALNWYRALYKREPVVWEPLVNKPVLFIWGNRDTAAGRKGVELQRQYVLGPYTLVEVDAEHWLLETRTKLVVDNILKHLASSSGFEST